MKEDLSGNQKAVPIGSREWLDQLRAGQEPDWQGALPASTKPNVIDKLPTPEIMRQFSRDIGRRGGLQRSRNFARRSVRKAIQFWSRHDCNPHKVKAPPVTATLDQRRYLHAYASRGGKARAARHSHEELVAIAAKGGRAKAEKAAKLKQAALCASAVAAKQTEE